MTLESNQSRGFTLIELLIGLSILALIMVVLTGSIGTTSRLLAREQSVATDRNDWIIQSQLRAWIETMPVDAIELENDAAFAPFRGDDNTIEFIRFEPAGVTIGGPTRYRLRFAGTALVLEREPLNGVAGFTQAPGERRRRVLFDQVDAAAFQFGAVSEQGVIWHSIWPLSDRAPNLVRLRYRRDGRIADMIMATLR